jgi:hypothetical protein
MRPGALERVPEQEDQAGGWVVGVDALDGGRPEAVDRRDVEALAVVVIGWEDCFEQGVVGVVPVAGLIVEEMNFLLAGRG